MILMNAKWSIQQEAAGPQPRLEVIHSTEVDNEPHEIAVASGRAAAEADEYEGDHDGEEHDHDQDGEEDHDHDH